MIINLCWQAEAVQSYLSRRPIHSGAQTRVWDVCGVCPPMDGYEIQFIREQDRDGNWEQNALEQYGQFSDAISQLTIGPGQHIRDWQVAGMPVYWLTKLSIKHDSAHWGQVVFLLREWVLANKEAFQVQGSLEILVPKSYKSAIPLLELWFSDWEIPISFPWGRFTSSLPIGAWLRQLKNYFWLQFKVRRKAIEVTNHTDSALNIFVCGDQTFLEGKRKQDLDLGHLIAEETPGIGKVLLPYWHKAFVPGGDFLKQSDPAYWKAMPGMRKAFAIFRKCIQLAKKSRQLSKMEFKAESFVVPGEMLAVELTEAVYRLWFYWQIPWLSAYLQKLDRPAQLLYTDEFYGTGRVLSQALRLSKNPKIKGLGIQHGIFFEGHTVYQFTEKAFAPSLENKADGLPVPDHFLVWGEYFRTLFGAHKSLPADFIQVSGNLKYQQRKGIQKTHHDEIKILWCTTLLTHARYEAKLLQEAWPKESNWRLVVRLHPKGHIKQLEILALFSAEWQKRISFDAEPSLLKSLQNHPLVLSTGSSTAFMDALVAGAFTIRVFSPTLRDGLRGLPAMDCLRSVHHAHELKEALKDYQKGRLSGENLDSLICLDPAIWQGILRHNLSLAPPQAC